MISYYINEITLSDIRRSKSAYKIPRLRTPALQKKMSVVRIIKHSKRRLPTAKYIPTSAEIKVTKPKKLF